MFQVYGNGIASISWTIFDRWGEKVYTGSGINAVWNGTMSGRALPPGVFIIKLNVEFIDGSSYKKNQSVLLLR